MDNNIDELLDGILKLSPPAVVSGIVIFGLSLSDWVYVFTIIYTLVGIITLIKKYWFDSDKSRKSIKGNKNKEGNNNDEE